MALIRGVNLKSSRSKTRRDSRPKILNDHSFPKPDTHPKWCLHSRLKESNRFLCPKSRVSTGIKSRTIESRISTAIKNRVCATIKSHVSTPLKFTSPLNQCDNHICEGCVLSHTRSMSLLYNQFNSTLARAINNSTGSNVHQQAN